MSHSIDQSLVIKGFFLKDSGQIVLHFFFITVIRYMRTDIIHHLHHHQVRPTMLAPLQRRHRRCDCRIGIRTRGRHYSCGKSRVVTTSMLHMKKQCYVQHSRLQLRIGHIRSEHTQEVFCYRQFRIWSVDIHTGIIGIMIVRMIAIYCQHRKCADQHHALPKDIG